MNYQLPVEAAWVRPYIGIPYVEDGDDLKTGINCWNLVARALQNEMKQDFPFYSHKTFDLTEKDVREMKAKEYIQFVHEQGKLMGWHEIPFEQHKKGDIVLTKQTTNPMHFGVVICKKWVLHTYADNQSAAERIEMLRVVAVFRYHGTTK